MKLVKDVLRKQKWKENDGQTQYIYGVTSLPKENNYKNHENRHINTLLK